MLITSRILLIIEAGIVANPTNFDRIEPEILYNRLEESVDLPVFIDSKAS